MKLTKDAGTAVIPNLSFVAMTRRQLDDLPGVLGDPEFRFLSPQVQEAWRRSNPTHRSDLVRFDRRERSKYPFVQKLTLALNKAGVPLLVGSDASAPGMFPGHSVHLELRELVKAGLTPRDALLAATHTPGQFIATHTRAPSFGTISKGSRADLLLVRRNPLENIENIDSVEGVMARGTWFTREALQQLRAEAAMRAEPAR